MTQKVDGCMKMKMRVEERITEKKKRRKTIIFQWGCLSFFYLYLLFLLFEEEEGGRKNTISKTTKVDESFYKMEEIYHYKSFFWRD